MPGDLLKRSCEVVDVVKEGDMEKLLNNASYELATHLMVDILPMRPGHVVGPFVIVILLVVLIDCTEKECFGSHRMLIGS